MTNNVIINSIGFDKAVDIKSFEIDNLENIFIFFRNIYDNNSDIIKSFLELVKDYYQLNENYIYKNIIVLPDDKNKNSIFNDNIIYILWFSKSENSYFNKDNIRESHIWKNVEWGKRKKNYSPKGKDPSNVWIPTKDNGKGQITEHISLKIEGGIERLFNAFSNPDEMNKWYYYNFNEIRLENKENIKKLIRNSSNDFLNKTNSELNETFDARYSKSIKKNTLLFESSEHISFPSSTVDLVVTSPPYWNLKDYFKKGQIGQESYEQYLDRLLNVWKECIRLMKPNTLFWININIRTHKKKPYFLPSDYILQMKKLGMHFKEIFIWHKSSSIPTTNKNLSDKYEVFLVFSNSEYININKETLQFFNEYKNENLRHGTIWNINRKAGSIGKKFIHPAIFPTQLIERIITISTKENSLVLDPFLGSGTTGVAAINNKRYFLGIEYNEGFRDLIEYRIATECNALFGQTVESIINQ